MFKKLVQEGIDYEIFSADKLPESLKNTGGILYRANNTIAVAISDNVPLQYRDIWVKHEIACNAGGTSHFAHHCRDVSETEIRELVPDSLLLEYVTHRVAMLQAAIQVNHDFLQNPDYIQYYLENPDKKASTELAIAKLTTSLEFFHEKFSNILNK